MAVPQPLNPPCFNNANSVGASFFLEALGFLEVLAFLEILELLEHLGLLVLLASPIPKQ